jgi:glycosyltransferase involved in cell wall biosynthesis
VKIALVSQAYDRLFPPSQNSIGLIAYYTALEIARHADVAVYGRHYRDDVLPAALPFSFARLPVSRDRALQKFIRRFPGLARRFGIEGKLDDHRQYRREVGRRIVRDRPDIVHVMNYWPWCRELRALGSSHRLVLEMQCEWLSQHDRGAVGHQLEVVDAVVAVSDHIARTFLAAFPDFPGPVTTVGNGVDVSHFNPRPEGGARTGKRRRILFVGRVSPEKGVHTLLEAFVELAARIDDVDLDIAGPLAPLSRDFLVSLSSDRQVRDLLRFYDREGNCTYRNDLEEIVARHGLGERVRFLGNVSHKELLSVYHASDLVVNPSLSESFGISVVEGMACGIPVVGTRVGGMCETILSGTTGVLVEPEAPRQLAGALASILVDPARAQRMGAAGRERAVQCYSWQARAQRLAALYGTLAAGHAETRAAGRAVAPELRARVQTG